MAFVLKRNLRVEVEMAGEVVTLEMTDLKATERLSYIHEMEVLQDRLDQDKSAVTDMYKLNIELLVSQATDIDGIIDEYGNKIKLPQSDNEKRELFDSLGLDFIIKASAKFSEEMVRKAEGKEKKK